MSKIPEEILQDGCKAYSEKFLNANGSFGEAIEAAYFAIHDHDDWVRAGPMEWNGEGLPPVGTVCEYQTWVNREWKQTKVLAHHLGFAVHSWSVDGDDMEVDSAPPQDFRPIRTPDQIAEEARENELNRMVATVSMLDKGWARKVCAGLYDAGYRKQDNAEGGEDDYQDL